MDYPHPTLSINASGVIDFSRVYTNEIGEWDKRAIRYGYEQFAGDVAETAQLQQLLEDNTAKGYLFIADADARAGGGMHPSAHLWDNGTSPVDELRNTLAVRKLALNSFSEKAIPLNTPMSKLEDALVPAYNYHRYQLEAVCKLVGGMDYSYSVRGDRQPTPTPLSAEVQKNALTAAINCLSPAVLTLPEHIIKLIPPRPPMYGNIGELFEKRSGMSFDPLAAASVLADFELSFLFHPERANRLVEFKARANTPGWDDVLTAILEKTWLGEKQNGLAGLVQLQTQQQVLTHLLALASSERSSYQVKATCFEKLQWLRKIAATKSGSSGPLRAHFLYTIERIDHPKDVVLPTPLEIPPGAPIGCDFDQ